MVIGKVRIPSTAISHLNEPVDNNGTLVHKLRFKVSKIKADDVFFNPIKEITANKDAIMVEEYSTIHDVVTNTYEVLVTNVNNWTQYTDDDGSIMILDLDVTGKILSGNVELQGIPIYPAIIRICKYKTVLGVVFNLSTDDPQNYISSNYSSIVHCGEKYRLVDVTSLAIKSNLSSLGIPEMVTISCYTLAYYTNMEFESELDKKVIKYVMMEMFNK